METKYLKYKFKYLKLKNIIKQESISQIGGQYNSFRIIWKESNSGIRKDIIFIKNVILKLYPQVTIEIIHKNKQGIIYEKINGDDEKQEFKNDIVDVQFFIEHIIPNEFNGRKSYLFINQEFLWDYDRDELLRSNIIPLCKTKYCKQVLESINIQIYKKCKYVGFGDINIKEPDTSKQIKNLFIHIAGLSPLKNTILVLNTWKFFMDKYPDSDAKLIVTVRSNNMHNKKINKEFEQLYKEAKQTKLPKNIRKGIKSINDIFKNHGSLYYFNNDLSPEYLNILRSKAMAALCPSAIEGWGHYIDECRQSKILAITLDAPPMNELIDEKSGILIPAIEGPSLSNILYFIRNWYPKSKLQQRTFTADVETFADKIYEVTQLSDDYRKKLVDNAYKKSKQDGDNFKNNMKELLQ
jgi:hypothetical protein